MEDLSIIVDGRILTHYGFAKAGFHGGTESYVRVLCHGLAERGHLVHVVAPDMEHEEMRGPTEFWWGPENFPRTADVLISVGNLSPLQWYAPLPPIVVLASNGVDADLRQFAQDVDGVACFSQSHIKLLTERKPELTAAKCYVTGLGFDPGPYKLREPHIPGRLLYSNDPSRGLWHVLDIFDEIRKQQAEASLHVAYDFERQFEVHKWQAHDLAELLWECRRRLAGTPGVTNLGALGWTDILREQMESHVHVMPSDPPNVGSQIHGMLQMELAAAGVPLILSETEAFPEVFGEAATILPVPGTLRKFDKKHDMIGRIDAKDWADAAVNLMQHPRKWAAASKKSQALAAKHTWTAMLDRWEAMLEDLIGKFRAQIAA